MNKMNSKAIKKGAAFNLDKNLAVLKVYKHWAVYKLSSSQALETLRRIQTMKAEERLTLKGKSKNERVSVV